MTNAAIIIPARYGSTRFEGKPLAELAGVAMVQHVYARALEATEELKSKFDHLDVSVIVATDDARIEAFCIAHDMSVVMTSIDCRTGSDRVLDAAQKMEMLPDIVLNLQGDNPFSSPLAMIGVLDHLISHPEHMVATPIARLSWDDLVTLRQNKATTPFSGTTVVVDEDFKCRWFSKNIIPAIRKEAKLRDETDLSPVYQHIGLYGYRMDALKAFVDLPEGEYEALEGLEQLRFLEHNIDIYGCPVPSDTMPPVSGIDTPEDMDRAEKLIKEGRLSLPDFNLLKGASS